MEKVKRFLFSNINANQIVIKNTLWLLIGEIAMRLLKMALIIYAARKLGADGWGIFSYAISTASLLMIFSDIGISSLITREVAKKNEGYKEFLSASLFLKGIISIISIILVLSIAPSLSNIKEANVLFPIIAFILFFDSIRDIGLAINRALEKMERETIIKIIMGLSILIFGFILIKINPIPTSMATAYLIGSALGLILIIFILRKNIRGFIIKVNMKSLGLVIRTTLPFAMITLVGGILVNTDIFMLGIWRTPEDIGIYSISQRFYQFILIIPSMIATATLPVMSRLANENMEKFKIFTEKIFYIFMIVAIPIIIGGIMLMDQIVPLIFGLEYLRAIPVLKILIVMLFVSFPLTLLTNSILVFNEQRKMIAANIFGVLINIVINFLLIPKWGVMGATIATVISTIVITYIMWYKMKKVNNFRILPVIKKIIIPVVIMISSILLLGYIKTPLIINIIISSVLYLGFLFIKERLIIKEVLSLVTIKE
ncbi:MAG: flippase [Candidatus Paceibacterota bacterium]|jgi:O-antigen/teichoic acid export membrane protein